MNRLLIDQAGIADLKREMVERAKIGTMQKGWKIFQKGAVQDARTLHGAVDAWVRDGEDVQVHFDLERFDRSGCTCPHAGTCEHMTAVFFYIYAQKERRPELFLHEHHQLRLRMKQEKKRKAQRLEKLLIDAKKETEAYGGIRATDSAKQWQRFFEKRFKHFYSSSFNQVDAFYAEATHQLLPVSEGWELPLRRLYRMHVLLFILKQTEAYYLTLQNGYAPAHLLQGCRHLFAHCQTLFTESAKEMPVGQKKFDSYLLDTIDFLHKRVFNAQHTPVQWLLVYQAFWWRLRKRKTWIKREQMWLEQRQSAEESPQLRHKADLALLHFNIMDDRIDLSMSAMKELPFDEPIHCDFYLRCFEEERDWGRLKRWLLFLAPLVSRATDRAGLERYFAYWKRLADHMDCDQEWNQVMLELLPDSCEYYAETLLQRRQIDRWIDLQIWMGASPLDLRPAELKQAEKYDLQLLLPLYHLSIDRLIMEKRRESYRDAVRLLITVKRYYEQMDRLPEWEAYIRRLSEKYHLLRAFHEEIRKGKLFS